MNIVLGPSSIIRAECVVYMMFSIRVYLNKPHLSTSMSTDIKSDSNVDKYNLPHGTSEKDRDDDVFQQCKLCKTSVDIQWGKISYCRGCENLLCYKCTRAMIKKYGSTKDINNVNPNYCSECLNEDDFPTLRIALKKKIITRYQFEELLNIAKQNHSM